MTGSSSTAVINIYTSDKHYCRYGIKACTTCRSICGPSDAHSTVYGVVLVIMTSLPGPSLDRYSLWQPRTLLETWAHMSHLQKYRGGTSICTGS